MSPPGPSFPAVDVDLICERATMASIGPFVSDAWREFLSSGGGLAGPGGYALPGIPYPPLDGIEETNAGDPKVAVADYLDRRGLDRAILDPGASGSLAGLANEVMGCELARATNDWLLAEWAGVDERLSASIVVTARDGSLAAKEIHRLGDDPRTAQVLFAYPPCLLGDRSMLPIFAAAEEHGLPIVLRAEGAYSGRNPRGECGWPSDVAIRVRGRSARHRPRPPAQCHLRGRVRPLPESAPCHERLRDRLAAGAALASRS
jgi:hypothetical protein